MCIRDRDRHSRERMDWRMTAKAFAKIRPNDDDEKLLIVTYTKYSKCCGNSKIFLGFLMNFCDLTAGLQSVQCYEQT